MSQKIAVVTGITGFLAAHVALTFLKNGWNVRGTLRSDTKRAAVLAIPEYKPYVDSGTLELYVTGPLESADYSQAIKGATTVWHVASPLEFGDQEFRETHLKPAVQGTRGILEVAAKEPSVTAVVVTSSYSAIGNWRQLPTDLKGSTFSEDEWNPDTVEDMDKLVASTVKNQQPIPDGFLFYNTSKKYAELEAWKVQKESGAKWSMATINPVMIWGPSIHPLTSLSHGGMSTEHIWSILKGPRDGEIMPTLAPYYVDVRDVAEAHYQAAVRNANGRFILSAGPYDYQEMADMARVFFPHLENRIRHGHPNRYAWMDPGVFTLKNDKSIKELGISYRSRHETFVEAMDRILELEKQGLN